MIYSDLPAGATVFVDASPFIHHFEPNALFGPASTAFLERIENQEISHSRDPALQPSDSVDRSGMVGRGRNA